VKLYFYFYFFIFLLLCQLLRQRVRKKSGRKGKERGKNGKWNKRGGVRERNRCASTGNMKEYLKKEGGRKKGAAEKENEWVFSRDKKTQRLSDNKSQKETGKGLKQGKWDKKKGRRGRGGEDEGMEGRDDGNDGKK